MVQLEQILKLKEQIQAEFRKHDYLHAEFIEFKARDSGQLSVTDNMGWISIETLNWLDKFYNAGIVFGGDFRTGEIAPYVIVE
jgi:hypothetical protein